MVPVARARSGGPLDLRRGPARRRTAPPTATTGCCPPASAAPPPRGRRGRRAARRGGPAGPGGGTPPAHAGRGRGRGREGGGPRGGVPGGTGAGGGGSGGAWLAFSGAGVAVSAMLYEPQVLLPELARAFDVSPAASTLAISAATAGLAVG